MDVTSTLVYCDNIINEITPQGPRTLINTPLSKISPVSIPGNYTFAISCSISGLELTAPQKIKLEFLNNEEDVLYTTRDIVTPPQDKETASSPINNVIQINAELRNLVLKTEGIYKSVIYINDTNFKEYEILVKKE